MATYGYARVSTARQATEGESLEVQGRQIEGYAMMRGLTLDEIVVEDVSGSVPVADRLMAGPMLAKLERGDVLIAAKLDRMFRSALDALQTLEALKARGVALHLIDIGGDVSGSGVAALFFTIVSAFAEFERARIRERVGAAKADQRRRKRFLGGRRPFGFTVADAGELVPDDAEQDALRRMAEMRKEGVTLRDIRSALSLRGVALSHEGIRKLLAAAA